MSENNHTGVKKQRKGQINYKLSLNEEQKIAKAEILNHAFSFIHGAAGTGKTLLSVQIALDLVFKREKNQIIITRPTVGTEDNGFLPGSLKEKLEPWMVPLKSNMLKLYDSKKIISMYDNEQIEMISLSHFRGRTFDDAVVIVDEYQNLTRAQLQMAVGRIGKNSIMIFCGDTEQIDLKDRIYSATEDIARIKNSKYVFVTELTQNHRHEAVQEVLKLLNGI
ncbi:MAG: PhoH family protein [Candidatus Kariarchaeum pelagius]